MIKSKKDIIEEFEGKLIYYCYINDTEKILDRLKNVVEDELNQKVKFIGSPLELCAFYDNFECFKAIAEKGAKIGSSVNKYGTLYNAFRYSPRIAKYIFENYKRYFVKAVTEKGYFIFCESSNLDLFNMVKEAGGDPNLIIDGRPVVYNFIETNNVTAIKFLLENGLNINLLDSKNRTLLDYAREEKAKKIIKLLELFNAI